MKYLLIAPSSMDVRHQPVAPLGLMAIATYLNARGLECIIFDRNVEKIDVEVIINKFHPDAIGISAFTGIMLLDALEMAKIAKKYKITVIFGGVHASLLPEQVLQYDVIDYVVVGEGENTTYQLLKTLENKGKINEIKGLAFKDGGKIIINEPNEFIDLSQCPITDWSLVKTEKYYQRMGESKRLLRIYTSKGCPGGCTFCYNQTFHKRTWRGRTPQQIVEEVKYLIDHYNIDGIGFIDELWSTTKERVYEICRLFRENHIQISWYFNARVDQYSKEDLQMLYDAGCRWLLFGIESGSKEMLKKIKKGINLERAFRIFQWCREIGICTIGSFMIGFPNETMQDLKQTIAVALKINPTYYDFTRYMCYPGTELYKECVAKRLFNEPKTLEEWARISSWDRIYVNMTSVTDRELAVINNYFAWLNLLNMTQKGQGGTLYGYIRTIFQHIKNQGILRSVQNFCATMKEVAIIIINVAFHPIIRYRYGMYGPVGRRRLRKE